MAQRFFSSLQAKLLLPMLGLVVLFIVCLALAVQYTLSEVSRQQSESFAAEIADIFSIVAEKNVDSTHLQRAVQLLAAHERIKAFCLVNATGEVIAANDVANIGLMGREIFPQLYAAMAAKNLQFEYMHEFFVQSQDATLLYHRLELLNSAGDAYGQYGLILSVENTLPEGVLSTLKLLALFGLGLMCVLWFLQYFYMRRILFFPLRRMVRELGMQKDLDKPLFLSRGVRDEIGRLADEYNQLLAQHFAARNELIVARDMAQQASDFKSQFLANISHEVRTPLNGMLGFAQLLLRSKLDGKQLEYIQRMLRSGESLLSIINDVLDFSKIEAGKLELHIGQVNIEQLCADLLALNMPRAEQKKIELCLFVAPRVPREWALDELRIKQILLNVISNAVKFTEKGYVLVRVDMQAEHCLCFSIKDTGIGMDASVMESIFRPFVQADATTTRRFGGTGLGLSIAQRLCHLMGGELLVESEVGAGTEFTVRLPVSADVPIPPENHQDPRRVACWAPPSLRQVVREQLASVFAPPITLIEDLDLLPTEQVDLLVIFLGVQQQLDALLLKRILAHSALQYVVFAQPAQVQTELPAQMQLLEKPLLQMDLLQRLQGSHGQSVQEVQDVPLRGRVLLVDDTEINRIVLRDYLEFLGVEVTEAANGEVASSLCLLQAFDVILMDCLMPVMDGYEATRQIRKRGKNQATPVIAITANAFADVEQACLDAGMTDYLAKPVALPHLHGLLQKYMQVVPQGVEEPVSEDCAGLPGARQLCARFGAERFARLVGVSEQSLQEYARELPEALEHADLATCARICHSIKSIAANYGDAGLQDMARELEVRFHHGEVVLVVEVYNFLLRTQQMLAVLRQINLSSSTQ